jgi:hypothetical protein
MREVVVNERLNEQRVYRIFKIQQIFALQSPQFKTDFFRLIAIIVINND